MRRPRVVSALRPLVALLVLVGAAECGSDEGTGVANTPRSVEPSNTGSTPGGSEPALLDIETVILTGDFLEGQLLAKDFLGRSDINDSDRILVGNYLALAEAGSAENEAQFVTSLEAIRAVNPGFYTDFVQADLDVFVFEFGDDFDVEFQS